MQVARGLHRAIVRVRAANAARVTATVLRKGRIVARSAHAARARAIVRLALTTPRHARLVIRIRALGPGGGAVRVVTLEARA